MGELWRATNELRVGVLVMDRGGSDVTLDYAQANSSRLEQTRVCQDRSSMPRPLERARAGSSRGPSSLECSSIGLRSARACSCATRAKTEVGVAAATTAVVATTNHYHHLNKIPPSSPPSLPPPPLPPQPPLVCKVHAPA